MAVPPTLHLRLLGTFSLAYGEEPVTGLNTPRPQSLLAYLALHRDVPHLRQHLAFVFWPDSSEAQARNNLRQTLHVLRLSLPGLETYLHADTNTLRWRPDAPFRLDVAEFEHALAQAEPAEQHVQAGAPQSMLEQAVNMYKADLLPSCYDEWVAPERERLRQRYMQALDRLIALLEAQRDYAAAVGYARRMISHDPLNEDACRHLMRLLPLKGDRAGALRVYHAYAGALERELGITPSPETTAAYEQVLRAEGMATSAAEQRQTPSVPPTLIGRQREWERLQEYSRLVSAGGPRFALLTGEAGIGKSRLAAELLLLADQHGAATAKSRCYAAEGRLSLAPVTEWLRSDGLRPHLVHLSRVWLTEVSRLLPELLSEYPDLPPAEPISEFGRRQRFFEALARAVLAAPQPLVLLIDDLQWCDQETLEWLHFLLRFDSSAQLLLVGTARDEELAAEHPLRGLLLDLHRTSAFTEIPLRPLDAAETAKLAAVIADRELTVTGAMRLYHETEGNPLFIVETMRAGLDDPQARREPADHPDDEAPPHVSLPLPPRVRAVIAARLANLSPPARELASLAATIGREFQLDILTRASMSAEDDIVRALDELWQRRIVREQGANAYDFTHDKLREVAYGETSTVQRRLLHRRIAQALETVHAGDLDPVSGQIASQYELAGLAEAALPYYCRAAEVARRVYANDDAITNLVHALALLELLPAGATRDTQELRILLLLAPLYRITLSWAAPELERVILRSLALCDALGAVAERAEVLYSWTSLLVVQAKLEEVLQVTEDLRAVYQRLQRAAPPLSGMMAASARLHQGHVAEAAEAFERMVNAYDPARPEEHQNVLGWNLPVHARAFHAHALWCLGYPDQALSRGLESVQLARDLMLPFNQALAATFLAMLQLMRAHRGTAKASAEVAVELALEYKAPYYRAWAAILLRAAEAGDRPDAAHLAEVRTAIDEFTASGARLRLPYFLWLLASRCGDAERIEEGLAVVGEALSISQANNERWWDAELHRLRGALLQRLDGNAPAVEAAFLQAAAIAHAQRARSLELRAATSLARWWGSRNRVEDAHRRLSDVYAWFTEGFDTPDLSEARTLLAELA